MPLDPNVILAAQAPQINPLQTYAEAQGIMNARAQNQLLQNANQEYQAKVAAGNLVGQAIDTQTGQFDRTKFNVLLSQNPNLAPYAMEALQGGNAAQMGQAQAASAVQNLTADKVKAYQSHLGLLSQILAPLGAPDAQPTKQDAYKAASQLISNPDLDPETRQQLVGDSVQFLGDLPDDPSAIKQRVKQLQLTVQDAQTRLNAITGQTGLTSNGSEMVPTTVNSYTGTAGPAQGGQPIPLKLSPEARASQVPSVGPKGEPGTVPLGSMVDDFGRPIAGAQPQPASAPSAQPQPTPGAAPGSAFHQTGLAPGTPETATANASQAAAAQAFANGAPERRALIQNLKDVSDQFNGGPMSAAWLKARQIGVEMGVLPKGSAASQEDFNKMALQLAQQQRQALGGHGTDAQTEVALHSNPNQTMSQEARTRVLAMLQGNEDAIQGRNAAWQNLLSNGKVQPQDWGRFTADFNKRFDPRAFQYQYMTPEQQQLMLKGMSADERTKFKAAQHFADWVRSQGGVQ
jgi:hypothetical protein